MDGPLQEMSFWEWPLLKDQRVHSQTLERKNTRKKQTRRQIFDILQDTVDFLVRPFVVDGPNEGLIVWECSKMS